MLFSCLSFFLCYCNKDFVCTLVMHTHKSHVNSSSLCFCFGSLVLCFGFRFKPTFLSSVIIVFMPMTIWWLTCQTMCLENKMFNLYINQIFNFGCQCLNQNHQLFPWILIFKRVGMVWVSFANFILSCYIVMENPQSYKTNVQATIIASLSFVNILSSFYFLHLVVLFKWYEKRLEVCVNACLFSWKKISIFPLPFPRICLSIGLIVARLKILFSLVAFFFGVACVVGILS